MSDDNQEVEHQSGISRLCNSILLAICVAPFVIIGGCFFMGWNERRAVCEQRAIAQGKEEVETAECSSSTFGNGKLIMFNCDLQKDGLPTYLAEGDFSASVSFQGVGFVQKTEMYQCVENEQSETKKDSVGGGTTTVKTYTYSLDWSSSLVDSGSFKKKSSSSFTSNCRGLENPSWPSGVSTSSSITASSAQVGAFTVGQSWLLSIPLNDPVQATSIPVGWTASGSTYNKASQYGPSIDIGKVRVSFYGNDWTKKEMTVLGENEGGTMKKWTAGDSWLCSGFTLGELRVGSLSKDELFAAKEGEASAMTWIFRVVGIAVLWAAFSCLFKPLEVAADCIPCIGPCLGDSISAITCAISCPMACGCGLGVAGIVWVAMRPMVGIPMIIVFLLCSGGFIAFTVYSKQKKNKVDESGPDPETVGADTA